MTIEGTRGSLTPLRRCLDAEASGTLRAEHGEVEIWLEVEERELLRLMLQEHLDLRAAIERRVSVRGADEVERTEVRDSERGLESLFGEVDVGRKLYQAEGHEGLAPLDAVLNLPRAHFSHDVRRFVAKEIGRRCRTSAPSRAWRSRTAR
ncbi:MAG: hypothetical protein OHK0013_00570 [Sandaracinaceae bacterium]